MFIWSILIIFLIKISSIQSIQFVEHPSSTFVLYPPLYLCNNGSFSLEFRTTSKTGLIFYTHDRFQHDWILISIVNGKLIVELKFGRIKSSQQFDQSINDDKWYKIVVKRRSSVITELALYSVALRNVENRIIKSKNLNYFPLTTFNRHTFVYLGGLPKNFIDKHRTSSDYLFPSFQGLIRNLRYGLCGCPERIQYPIFSSLSSTRLSEVCEEQISLCSSSFCECLNVDEEPRYQCDCSNKTCHIITQMSK